MPVYLRMLTIFYALIPVLAWGTWLTPSQKVNFPSQQVKILYVSLANLALAGIIFLFQGPTAWQALNPANFALGVVGGIIWALAGLCGFTATDKIGQARAFGIWAPLNIIVSMIWGALLFHEFLQTGPYTVLLLAASLLVIIAGVLMIVFAKGASAGASHQRRDFWIGLLGAVGAGILWGSYFIPIQYAGISMWIGAFPLALGICAGSLLLLGISRPSIRLHAPSDYLRVLSTGLIWAVGNYGMLLLVAELGAGRGFTIAQLSVVVNALMGIFVLKDPAPRTRAALLTLIGCVLATLGGVALGNLK